MLKTGFELPLAVTGTDLTNNETLMYDQSDGHTWVRQARDDQPTWPGNIGNWHARCATNADALQAARAAGFNPTAIYYPRKL